MGTLLQRVVKEYRRQQRMSAEEFGRALAENIPGQTFSRQVIQYWESGKQTPGFPFLMSAAIKYGDWRRDFAFDCLAAIYPDYYQPATNIGREKQRS